MGANLCTAPCRALHDRACRRLGFPLRSNGAVRKFLCSRTAFCFQRAVHMRIAEHRPAHFQPLPIPFAFVHSHSPSTNQNIHRRGAEEKQVDEKDIKVKGKMGVRRCVRPTFAMTQRRLRNFPIRALSLLLPFLCVLRASAVSAFRSAVNAIQPYFFLRVRAASTRSTNCSATPR